MKIMRKTLLASAMLTLFSVSSYAKTPIDLGVVNEDKLIEMLVRQGFVEQDANDAVKHDALDRYLKNKLNCCLKIDQITLKNIMICSRQVNSIKI